MAAAAGSGYEHGSGENVVGGVTVENFEENVTSVGETTFLNLEGNDEVPNTILGGQTQFISRLRI